MLRDATRCYAMLRDATLCYAMRWGRLDELMAEDGDEDGDGGGVDIRCSDAEGEASDEGVHLA